MMIRSKIQSAFSRFSNFSLAEQPQAETSQIQLDLCALYYMTYNGVVEDFLIETDT